MPTINQLVRKGRKTGVTKSTAPALQHGYNSMKKKLYYLQENKNDITYSRRNHERLVGKF